MAHHHSHSKSHQHRPAADKSTRKKLSPVKALWLAVIITFAYAGVEALFGWQANSLALLSDAGHMLSDSLALVMAAVAAWIATKPPSAKHTYGLGRAEVIGAWFSTIFILAIAVGIIVEAVKRFHEPEAVTGSTVIIVAGIGLAVNMFVAWILSLGEKSLNIRAAILHVLGDMLGSIAALISGAVIYFTGWMPIDPLLSIVISILILLSSIRLLKESFRILMEGVPHHIDLNEVSEAISGIQKVQSVHDLHIWTLSSGIIVLTAHVEIDRIEDWETLLEKIRALIEEKFDIDHITLQPETPGIRVKHHLPCHYQKTEE